MNEDIVIKIDKNIETICCDGGEDELGHPAVYYTFDQSNVIVCGYCGKKYLRENRDNIENR